MSFLQVENLVKRETGIIPVNDVSFVQGAGERLAIVGETGSGKSTLLKMAAGLVQADDGAASFMGKRIKGPKQQLLPGHPRIAYLSQHYELRNHYRVEEVLGMANQLPAETALGIYEICRISHLLKRRTSELSGGERQRIALAQLITTLPQLLILDEPFSNLDLAHKSRLIAVLRDIGAEMNITFLLASHDPQDVMAWAERILVLKNGQIIQEGQPEDIYRRPASEYVAGLFGRYNVVQYGPDLVMVRPEDVQLATYPGAAGSLPAIVTTVRFGGFYQEVELNIQGMQLTAFSLDKKQYAIGEKVAVSIRSKQRVEPSWRIADAADD